MGKQTIFEVLGFSLAFLGLGIAYLAVYLGIRSERRKRELEHIERMRALELGRRLPGEGPWLSPLRLGFLIAVVVPICLFGIAWLATRAAGYHEDIWTAAGYASFMALPCGAGLAALGGARPERERAATDAGPSKPRLEEDAYDVVSTRG